MNFAALLVTYSMPLWIIISFFVFILIIFGFVIWLFWLVIKKYISDIVIFYDKNDRWELLYTSVKGKETLDHKDKTYYLNDKGGNLNNRGKSMYHFTENKPEPMIISHGKSEWLSAESLNAAIKNKVAQQIIKPTDKLIDMLILFGAIGGILAAISSVIVLLISTGVIKLN